MKKITLLLVMIGIVTMGNAQDLNFETPGTSATFTGFAGAVVSIVNNPVQNVKNPSSKVLQFTIPTGTGGDLWAGAWSSHSVTVSGSGLVRLKAYKPVKSGLIFKLEYASGNDPNNEEISMENSLVDEWETIEYDFSGKDGIVYPTIVIMPDWTSPRSSETVVYIDDIEFFPVVTSVYQEELDDSKVYKSGDKVIYKSTANITEVSVVNIGGSTVLKDTQLNGELNISSLQKGVYLVVLKSGKTSSAFKIVK
ncbi:T9SS type A sorting domain-containing protein [Labilibacter sediminis]|nr:T9SS type A sorting domain-containing protein [Labilibacter sediminis]